MKWKQGLKCVAAMLLCGVMIAASACSREIPELSNASGDYPFTVNGVTVQQAVARVAVYSDSLADVIMQLGSKFQLKLTARGSDCVHPDIQVLPMAGTTAMPDAEQLKALEVELVLTDTALSETAQDALTAVGIQTLVCPPATDRNSLVELYRTVAAVLGGAQNGSAHGEKRANNLLMALDDIKRVIPQDEVLPVVGYVLDEKSTFASDQTLSGKLFAYVNAMNVAGEQAQLSADELNLSNPSILFCAEGLSETIRTNADFAETTAVKNNRIIELPNGAMVWQGASLLNGMIRVAITLYPEMDSGELLPEAPPTSSEPETSPERPVSVDTNSSYADILLLQDRLIELGYMKPPGDGVYGYWTQACIKEFQRRAGLKQTGIADRETMNALYAEDAPKG